ncbi:MAG: hypothetical protein RI907_748 [Pseudomonadota bacterium]|jgi:predicted Zn-dependent protease
MITPDHFHALADAVLGALPGPDGADAERISLHLQAEHSHFIRFNHGQVRQATDVAQAQLSVSRCRRQSDGPRMAGASLSLSGVLADDVAATLAAARALGDVLPHLPPDPHLLLPDTVQSTHSDDLGAGDAGHWPDPREVVQDVHAAAQGLDVVGLYAAGPVVRAFADNRGQRNWHRATSFALDWSHVLRTDQAVKAGLAGAVQPGGWTAPGGWREQLHQRMAQAARQMHLLARPQRQLSPGRYRAWLAPAAVGELMGTLAWGAFGLKEQRTGTSPFNRLVHGEALSPLVSLSETTAPGLAAAFTPQGFVRPGHVPLVAQGAMVGSLVSPRSAREFGTPEHALTPNAHGGESPEALHLAPGTLADAEVLAQLGTGLYLSNLHYLNYSDRLACRVTGMTRYACFWVEDGQLVAPLPVMRFDQDLVQLLGDDLIALGEQAEWQPNTETYGARNLGGVRAPGALVKGLNLTL